MFSRLLYFLGSRFLKGVLVYLHVGVIVVGEVMLLLYISMGWLRSVGSIKLKVSFAE